MGKMRKKRKIIPPSEPSISGAAPTKDTSMKHMGKGNLEIADSEEPELATRVRYQGSKFAFSLFTVSVPLHSHWKCRRVVQPLIKELVAHVSRMSRVASVAIYIAFLTKLNENNGSLPDSWLVDDDWWLNDFFGRHSEEPFNYPPPIWRSSSASAPQHYGNNGNTARGKTLLLALTTP